MPNDIFYWVFNMSITAALTGAVVMLIRMIRIIPRRFAVLLWIIPYMRMVLPFGLDQPYSLMSLVTRGHGKVRGSISTDRQHCFFNDERHHGGGLLFSSHL